MLYPFSGRKCDCTNRFSSALVLILGLIQTLITFQGNLNTWWTRIVVGMLVLVFILLQNVISTASRRLGEAQRRQPLRIRGGDSDLRTSLDGPANDGGVGSRHWKA